MKNEMWILAHVFRHPTERIGWYQAFEEHGDFHWIKSFGHPPSNSELESCLSVNHWWSDASWWYGESVGPLSGPDGFRVLDADVCINAWHDVIGSAPRMTFPASMLSVGGIPKMLAPSESVRLADGSIVIDTQHATISSDFQLHNRDDATTVKVGFPERSWDRTHLGETKETRYSTFQCFVDDKPVPVIRIPEFFHPRELIRNVERCLLVATISFGKGELHRMRVIYGTPVGNDLRDGRFIGYTLATANSWPSIGRLLITAHSGGVGDVTPFPSDCRRQGSNLVSELKGTKGIADHDLLIRWTAGK